MLSQADKLKAERLYLISSLMLEPTESNFEQLFRYTSELPWEVEFLAAVHMINRNSQLCDSKHFIEWVKRSKQLPL